MIKMLKGKIAVVTGASKGIGAETALVFAESGAKGIVIADVIEDKAVETCKNIEEKTGCKCIYQFCDVSNEDSVKELFKKTLEEFGTVDILVNCAGIVGHESVEEMDGEKFDKAINVNLRGTYLCSREALMIMKKNKYGKIINFSSISGQIGGIATAPSYAASKGGIISLTMSFAKAGAPYNVNVNAVAPGMIMTDMAKGMDHFKDENVPLGRIGTPRDVANVVEFLASEKSSYITGVTLSVNGGMFMCS